jgi:hypothetical protein
MVVGRTALAAFLSLAALPATAQAPAGPCGASVVVERGDTLSRIAERCEVSERAILSHNGRIESSQDLRVGMRVALAAAPGRSGGTVDQLRSLAEGAGEALSGAARDIGSSVDDLLEKNPDLRNRLRSFGGSLTGETADVSRATLGIAPERGPTGAPVTLTASGLPADADVVIGGGPPRSAYEILAKGRTGSDGRLTATVQAPDWAADAQRFVFVVAREDGAWIVRSAPYAVTGSKL